jgi:hypothetical protein
MLYDLPKADNINQCKYRLFDRQNRSMCAQGILLYGCGWDTWLIGDVKEKGQATRYGAEHWREQAISLLIRESRGEKFEDAEKRWRKIQLMNDVKDKSFIQIADMLKEIDL